MESESVYDSLINMGFDKIRVENALKSTNNDDLQTALDWLISHELDVPVDNLPSSSVEENELEATDNKEGDNIVPLAKSMKCDDCGKLLPKEADVQFHATKFGHLNFSESLEEVKPFTEEEKKFQMEKLQEKMKQKRLEREAFEAKESLQRERYRRLQGKTIIDAKTKFEEDELKRLADQKRREKEEDRIYREKLKNQIASDREARKKNFEPSEEKEISVVKSPPEIKAPIRNFDSCRIQVRHSQGASISETFSPNDSLSKVALWFSEKTGLCNEYDVEFRTTMPPKLYGAEYMSKTVKELGFCPSIVLMAVVKKVISVVKSPSEIKAPVRKYDSCRIQVRYSQGASIAETFSPNDLLSKVALWFSRKTRLCNEYDVEFRTTMPPKRYGPGYMSKTVKELGFCPSIVLMAVVKKVQQY